MTSSIDKAREAWGGELPQWVEALARECDAHGQRATAARVGYSQTVVNHVLSAKYGQTGETTARGKLSAVEMAVRGTLLQQSVTCPLLGEIPADRCNENQKAPWASHNPTRVLLYRACRNGCVNSRIKPK